MSSVKTPIQGSNHGNINSTCYSSVSQMEPMKKCTKILCCTYSDCGGILVFENVKDMCS